MSQRVDVELAPLLGATRAGASSAASSRDVLLTVLGELMLPAGGTAWTQTLTASLAALGIQDRAARQTIARLHERGWLDKARHGRQTRWSLTSSTRQLLTDGAERIYGFGQAPPVWDQRWTVVLASVPEAKRNLRYRLATGLTWAGFGSLGQGTWVSPWQDREPEAASLLAELGVDKAASFRAELGAVGSADELAARAWDLDAVRLGYDAFLTDVVPRVAEPAAGGAVDPGAVPAVDPSADSARRLILLVHDWRRFPFLDPGLPDELLPADWPGRRAASTFTELRAELRPAAMRWWLDLDASHGPAV